LASKRAKKASLVINVSMMGFATKSENRIERKGVGGAGPLSRMTSLISISP
jgi:hypothetical protein